MEGVERKILAILKVLSEADRPLGARAIAKLLTDKGINLTERAVRYHLKIMDERGLTRLVGRRDGREITEKGRQELQEARVRDKVGFVLSRIEALSFMTTFNPRTREGVVPINLSFLPRRAMKEAFNLMSPAFEGGYCVSPLVKVLKEGEGIGGVVVPRGKVGLVTVCSIVINGVLLKAGVPMDSKFGGILQVKEGKPYRFVDLIYYAGTSLDPSEAFLRANMTSVAKAAKTGDGKVLANFREIPALCRDVTMKTLEALRRAGIGGVLVLGGIGEDVCEIPVEPGRIGMVLLGGLNPVACIREAGYEVENLAMSGVIPFRELEPYDRALKKFL